MARPTGWDILGLDGDPTPGVVETVQALAKQFGDFAHDVEDAYGNLNRFGSDATAMEWVGQTAEAFKGQFGPLPGRLQKLYISYSEASDALSSYAPKLQAAQSKADSALRQAQDANVDLQRATSSASNAAADLKTAQQNHAANPNPQTLSDAQTAHDTAQSNLKNAQARMDALKAQAHQAHDDLDTAAKDCAKALHHAQHDGIHNKHWWQHVGEALSEWGGKIAEIANEIAPVLDALAIATVWIPGVDIVTGALAEADNTVAMFATELKETGDAMQGHFGDALMDAGMVGVGLFGGKALGKLGGKVLSKLGREAEGGAKDTANAEARAAERDGGNVENETIHAGADGEPEPAQGSGDNAVGEDVRTSEGNQDANTRTDPVDVVSGWMLTDATDVELPGVLPLVLRRAYASGYATGRLFGPGWSSTLDQRLSINTAGIHFAGDDTQRLDYPIPDDGQEVLPVRGARWPLVWDHESDEILITDPWTGHTRHFDTIHYADDNGQIRDLTAITDRNGNRIKVLRDGKGTPTGIEHPGYMIAVDTAASSAGPRVTALRLMGAGAGSGTTLKRFHYDARGCLTGVVNSSDQPFTYEWDENSRISAWQDRSGYRYEYTYDHVGRVIRGDGAFLSGTFDYYPANRTTIVTNSLGHATTIVYDEYGHVCSETDPLGNTTITNTDRYGRVLSHIDALGHTTVYERDDKGDARRVMSPDGGLTDLDYNEFHQITAMTAPDGARWVREYDERGNLTAVTDPTGAKSAFGYAENGALARSTDPLGAVTTYTSDAAGQPIEVLNPAGGTTRRVRDSAGRVVRVTNPLGAVTSFEWDIEGLPVSRTDPLGAVTRWEHDAGGRLLKTINPIGAVTLYEPGPMDMLNARTDPDGVRHSFAYDGEMSLLAVTNSGGASWSFRYDPAGRLIGEKDFNGRHLGYEYDPAGRLSTIVTGTGARIAIERDPVGRAIARRTPEGEYRYIYDPSGQLMSAVGPDTALEYERDSLGRVLTETVDGRTTRYTYDAAGRIDSRTTSSGAESSWSFDSAGRPARLVAGESRLELSYDMAGQEVGRQLGVDVFLINQYGADGRRVQQRLVNTGHVNSFATGLQEAAYQDVVMSRSWLWRADGVPEEIRDSLRGTRRITNDNTGRPTSVSAAGWTETYVYDSFGNRITKSDPAEVGTDKEPAVAKTLVRRSGRTHHDYDEAGRLVRTVRRTLDGRRKTWTYTWDSQDRLVRADIPDNESWHYTYDPTGRRTSKYRMGENGQSAEQILFTWDGPRLAEEIICGPDDVVTFVTWDYDPGTFRPAAQRRRSWAAEADQGSVDEVFHAVITDLVGAPMELVTSQGGIAWRSSTDIWGHATGDSMHSEIDCPLRFPGQYFDTETRLCYNLSRYYDPEVAAYLTPDPLGLTPSPNDHAYVPNPLTFSDPLGLAYEGKTGNWTGERTTVANQDELLQKAMDAAGGDLDYLTEVKPGWWQGVRPDGKLVRIEWEPVGHQNTNEGPHVTVRFPRDPSIGAKSGWSVAEKWFIEGQETWRR